MLATNLTANKQSEFATDTARAHASDTVYQKVFKLLSQAREAFELVSTLGDAEIEIDPEIEIGASALSERGDKTALVREMGALVRELKQWSEVEAGGGSGGTDGGGGIAVPVDGSGAVDALADGWE